MSLNCTKRHATIKENEAIELSFYRAWQEHSIGFACVHEVGNTTTVSKIDHIFLSSNINDQGEEAGVIHHVNNKSDDSPVFAVFSSLETQQETAVKKTTKLKPSWRRKCAAERENYRQTLDEKLRRITLRSEQTPKS